MKEGDADSVRFETYPKYAERVDKLPAGDTGPSNELDEVSKLVLQEFRTDEQDVRGLDANGIVKSVALHALCEHMNIGLRRHGALEAGEGEGMMVGEQHLNVAIRLHGVVPLRACSVAFQLHRLILEEITGQLTPGPIRTAVREN